MKFINYKRQFFLGFLCLLVFAGCQRDDICPETVDTTPMLVINFYNNTTREPRTSVNLTVREVGREPLDMLLYRENRQTIRIPLKTGENSTKLEFIYDGPVYNEKGEIVEDEDNNLETNTDIIEFTYNPEEEYINRACSFKVNYLNIDYITEGGEDGRWISSMRFLTNNITTDNFGNDNEDDDNGDEEDAPTAHLNIFFD
ncbi:DUF6452 family protein [Zunongwangia pacifica]|uniref:DUF6452 family protein n=1 Tax=Zunongwangia pacifica TaxID=2911062 RepID=A0A9X2CQQ1_9FLAO|nr:DUF6452 family protein [Zunongwangia pacifica]MCL6220203.1 DUF6452 family protein [Zunongwangia pacifica]